MKNFRTLLRIGIIGALLCEYSINNTQAQVAATFTSGNGLTYTAQEVNIWRGRAQSGPYRVAGDAQTNSPGDYQRIKANSSSFISDPSGDRWNGGYQGGGCVPKGTTPEIMGYEPKAKGDKLRDAAFIYLLSQDQRIGRVVVDELLRYVRNPLIGFSNRSRWCWGTGSVRDVNPGFFIAEWVTKMLYAYDYVRTVITDNEKQEIEKWLLNAGLYFQKVNDDPTTELFSDRARGVLKDPTYWSQTIAKSHHDGYNIPRLASHYNNRRGSIARLLGQVGLLVNNAVLKQSARQFYIDWFKYAIFPDGMLTEYFRGDSSAPEKGYHYSLIMATLMSEIADAFARAGDTSLYDFTTSEGIGMTVGGKKNLLTVLIYVGNQLDGSKKRYFPGFPNQEAYHLDGIDPTGRQFLFDTWFSTANMYFRNDYIRSIYLRQKSGTRPYPSNPANVGYSHTWSSTHGTAPGLLFMHGKMEGLVWPFPDASNPTPTDSPTPTPTPPAPVPTPTPTPTPPVPVDNAEIVVDAKGYAAGGVFPMVRVYANKNLIGQMTVGSTAKEYRFKANMPQAQVTQIMVQYTNDAVINGQDRNLYVQDVKIGTLSTVTPSSGNSIFDKGELDGKDVVSGRQLLPWSGYLIFNK